MKKSTIKTFVLRMAFAAILAVSCQASTIFLQPSTSTVNAGDTFTVDVIAQDLNLGGYQLTIGFNPVLVSLTSTAFGNFLGAPLSFATADQQIDTVQLDELSFADSATLSALQGDGAAGNLFTLATLTFNAANAGTANFSLVSGFLTDLNGQTFTADLADARVEINGAGPIPNPVPEPASWMLIPAGLALVFKMRS